MRELEGGVGIGEALGANVRDAVAFGVGGLRRGPEGEIGAHAVGRGEAGTLADQHRYDLRAERARHRIAERHASVAARGRMRAAGSTRPWRASQASNSGAGRRPNRSRMASASWNEVL